MPQYNNVQLLQPQQQGLQNSVIQQALQMLQGRTQPNFENIRNATNENFQQNTLPLLLERLNAGGYSPSGSATQRALSGAAQGLNTQLSGQEAQFGQQQQGLDQQLFQMLLGHGLQQTSYQEEESPWFNNLLSGLGSFGGAALGGFMNPGGTAAGLASGGISALLGGLGGGGQQSNSYRSTTGFMPQQNNSGFPSSGIGNNLINMLSQGLAGGRF